MKELNKQDNIRKIEKKHWKYGNVRMYERKRIVQEKRMDERKEKTGLRSETREIQKKNSKNRKKKMEEER